MKRRRHTPEQMIRKLREADRLLAEGKTVEEVCAASRDRGVDVASVASAVRRHEGQRREAAQGARGREHAG